LWEKANEEANPLDDATFLELLNFRNKSLDETIDQLERLLACGRTELIIFRPELEMGLARLKEIHKNAQK
jgi:hypothetical protein